MAQKRGSMKEHLGYEVEILPDVQIAASTVKIAYFTTTSAISCCFHKVIQKQNVA